MTAAEFLAGMTQTILCTSVQWTCGHYTTTVGEMPRYCPICTGQSDVKFLEVHMNLPPALDKPV